MKLKLYQTDSLNPWFNLALEDWLFQSAPEDTQILFLWRNQPSVIIGRAQNPWVECNLAQMEQDEVLLARRQSGGGAVYHDLGNTNFTFISPIEGYDKQQNFAILTEALATLGLNVEVSGRNDMLLGGRKFSGSAFRQTKTKAFHHGTLLLNADLTKLQNYLNPSKKKLEAKGVKSVRSRVINLQEQQPNLTHEILCHTLFEQTQTHYGHQCDVEHCDLDQLESLPELKQRYQQLQDWDWRYGRTLRFTHELSQRFTWGEITLQLEVNKGIIRQAQFHSDALELDWLESLVSQLINCPYQAMAIGNTIMTENHPHAPELISWLQQALSH